MKTRAILALALLSTTVLAPAAFYLTSAEDEENIDLPPLSQIALHSPFARAHNLGYVSPTFSGDTRLHEPGSKSNMANRDFNRRPQNEPSIAVNPNSGTWVVGANDYGIGFPIGGGVYTNVKGTPQTGETYFPPFPALCGRSGTDTSCTTAALGGPSVIEPPVGTGDAVIVYSVKHNEFYYTSLGFSFTFCENGLFLYRSSDGLHWTRPIVPNFAPPKGLRTVVYHDNKDDCSVFHDKEWMTVDNNPGSPFFGRIYVTWTRFVFDPKAVLVFIESPIMLAFSDDRGETFSDPIEVSGASTDFCGLNVSTSPPSPNLTGKCNQNQFSVPVVAADGSVYVAFMNFQNQRSTDIARGRTQYLVVRVIPAASAADFKVEGPLQAVYPIFNGRNDYPSQSAGTGNRQTLCNSNFRVNSAGNIAIGPKESGGTSADAQALYIVWSDNRRHAGEFPFRTRVGSQADGFPCPAGKNTDVDVFAIKSTDGGRTWTSPLQVNRDKPVGATNDVDQWFPWVDVDQATGKVAVLYHDRRYDTTPRPNKLARTTLATSTDLQTWKEADVAGFPSNFDDASFGRGTFIGDYIQVVFTPTHTYAVFTGVLPGKQDSDIFIPISGG